MSKRFYLKNWLKQFIIITAALSYTVHPHISTSERVYKRFRISKHKPCVCPTRWTLKSRQVGKHIQHVQTAFFIFSGSASWVSRCNEFSWGRPEIYISVGTEIWLWTADLVAASSQKMLNWRLGPYSHHGSACLIPSCLRGRVWM